MTHNIPLVSGVQRRDSTTLKACRARGGCSHRPSAYGAPASPLTSLPTLGLLSPWLTSYLGASLLSPPPFRAHPSNSVPSVATTLSPVFMSLSLVLFLDSTRKGNRVVFVSLCIIPPRCVRVDLTLLLWLNTLQCACPPQLYPSVHPWTLGLPPGLGYCK